MKSKLKLQKGWEYYSMKECRRPEYFIMPGIPRNVSPKARLVWAALCSYGRWQKNARGVPIGKRAEDCFPSERRLVDDTGIGLRSVQGALRELEQAGYIRTVARWDMGKNGQRAGRKSNGYDLFPHGGGGDHALPEGTEERIEVTTLGGKSALIDEPEVEDAGILEI